MLIPGNWERKNENYTYYQTGSYYDVGTDCQTDAVKVCIFRTDDANKNMLKSFFQSPSPKPILADFAAAQDPGGVFIGNDMNHPAVIKKQDGSNWQFGLLPGLPYILPTKEWNDFIAQKLIVAIDEGAVEISIQELGVFGDSGYERAFRDEWQEFFGTEWSDKLWSDPNLYFMGQDLRNYLATRQVEQIFAILKDYNPNVKRTFANHTPQSYFGFFNSVGNHDIMGLDIVDGVEGQSWSNTILLPFRYDGKTKQRPFAVAFSEYSYWSVLGRQFPDKKVAVITDPKGDGFDSNNANFNLKQCEELYRHQIVSQLAFSDIYRYNTNVWPDRSLSRGHSKHLTPVSDDDFNTVICNIISLQANMYKYKEPIISESQPVKIGALLLDSMNYPAGGPNNQVTYDSFYGSFAGLMYNGLMVESIPFGKKPSANEIFADYDLIIASYDLMKPQNSLINENLAKYTEDGGIVLFMSGIENYENLESAWWKKAGLNAPQDDLIARFGIHATQRKTNLKTSKLFVSSDAKLAQNLGEISASGADLIGYASVDGATPLFTTESGDVIMFEKSFGKGCFYYLGVAPNFFGDTKKGDVLFNIVKEIISEHRSIALMSRGNISYRRGPLYGFSSLTNNNITSTGKFIDMFSPKLSVVSSLEIPEGKSILLLDVEEKFSKSEPAVLFAQGNSPTIYETPEGIRIVTAGPFGTLGAIRAYLPNGQNSAKITAVDAENKNALVSSEWDEASKTILIKYNNDVMKVTVDVTENKQI